MALDADERGRLCELLRKNVPVGVELQSPSQSGQHGKSTMPMDAFFELRGLGPRVGVQEPMAVQFDAGLYKAKPKWLGFCAKQQVILRSRSLMFCQPMSGLIDTDHQRIGMRLSDERCAHAGAAE